MKSKFLQLRMSPELKSRLASAAAAQGKSITTFVMEAVVIAIRQAKPIKRTPKGVHRGAPSFFKACCAEAKSGGGANYRIPGYHLSIHLGDEIPGDIAQDEWSEELDKLRDFLNADNDDSAWEWFKEHYPRCMKLVPTRRKAAFLRGVKEAYEQDRI